MNDHRIGRFIGAGAAAALALALLGTCAGPRSRIVTAEDVRAALGAELERTEAPPADRPEAGRTAPRLDPRTIRAYRDRNLEPFWVTAAGPNAKASVLRGVLAAADTHGLDPKDYAMDEISRLWGGRDASGLACLEVLLTAALDRYLSDLIEGRRQPRDFDPEAFPTACDCQVDAPALVERAVTAPDLRIFLEEQAPPFHEYRVLRAKLAEYRALAARGGWPAVPPGGKLRPGDRDPRVAALRGRLAATGECPAGDPGDGDAYAAALAAAVRRFQRHHGLEADGVVGAATVSALDMPVERRVRQLIVNMETWRWVSRDRGDWWIAVNIPSFHLIAVRNGRVELDMPVIVGDERHMTPVFSEKLRTVEFNPFWEVPLSITRKEFLPKLRTDPAYLKRQGIRIFEGWEADADEVDPAGVDWGRLSPDDMGRYRMRQDPGPGNSLGRFAFLFPNPFDVYLHDTPAVGLFEAVKRTFSHGCIRVARARELAAYVLGGPDRGWTDARIDALLAEDKSRNVPVDRPIVVYILYNTAVVDPRDADVYFFEDVYGRDALLEKAIF